MRSRSFRYKRFILGNEYRIHFWYHSQDPYNCKFIKVTRCGYNFLNLNTNKCLFPNHFYIDKKAQAHLEDKVFRIYNYCDIEECES